ncbi:MAG: RNA polymerase sigma factor [Bacteroidota bacterium]
MSWFTPSYTSRSDEELMRCVAQGEEEAFEVLYQRYSGKMLSYFYRLLNQDEEKAQDMLQDLFMKLVEKPYLFDPSKRFSTWIYAIASNMVKNEYRSREVRKIMTRPDDWSKLSLAGIDSEPNLDFRAFEHGLEDALKHLSAAHREVFVLRYQEELSIKEISEVMCCSEGTVKSRIFYSLRKLSRQLQAFDPKEH